MAAEGEIIKSFLVGLGFDVDESTLGAFNKSIRDAATRVTALYGAINAFAGGIFFAFTKVSQGFEQMGYQYHIIAPTVNKLIVLRNAMIHAYRAAGIHIRQAVVESYRLNMSISKTKFALEAIYKSVATRFFGVLLKQSDEFRKHLYHNMPYIVDALTKMVKFIFKAFNAATILGERLWSILSRVYQFFVSLNKATDGWSTVIFGVIAAWKLLNLSFLATPLGMLLAGFTALLALWDDFKTYQEGGKSFFNWGPVIPIIRAFTTAFEALYHIAGDTLHLIGDGLNGKTLAVWRDFRKILSDIDTLFTSLNFGVDALFRHFGGGAINSALNMRDSVDNWFFGKANEFGSFLSNFSSNNDPLGAFGGSQTNTNANLQTQITITGSPNADATARATAREQQNVNRDFVRNLKGASR